MPQNDDVRFTSSSLKIPLNPPKPSPFNFPFGSQLAKTRNSLAQLVDSVKTGSEFKQFDFSRFWNRLAESTHSAFLSRDRRSASSIGRSSLLCSASLSLTRSAESVQSEDKQYERLLFVPKSALLCSASLALTRAADESSSSQKGLNPSRSDEDRVLISEVLVRNKDGEELERKDLEMEALQALKASRDNSALTVREVQEDVHRIIYSGYFQSCIPVAMDTRDGIRLVFQVSFLLVSSISMRNI